MKVYKVLPVKLSSLTFNIENVSNEIYHKEKTEHNWELKPGISFWIRIIALWSASQLLGSWWDLPKESELKKYAVITLKLEIFIQDIFVK